MAFYELRRRMARTTRRDGQDTKDGALADASRWNKKRRLSGETWVFGAEIKDARLRAYTAGPSFRQTC